MPLPAPPPAANPFVALLQQRRPAGLSNNRFATTVLGISPGAWSMAQRNTRAPSTRLLAAALRAFPQDRAALVAAFQAAAGVSPPTPRRAPAAAPRLTLARLSRVPGSRHARPRPTPPAV